MNHHITLIRRHLIGKPAEHWTDEDEASADAEIRRGFVFLRRKRTFALDADHLLNRLEFAVRVHGVRVIAIDPFNEIEGGVDTALELQCPICKTEFKRELQVNADFFSKATPAFAAAGRMLRQLKFAPTAPAPGRARSTS